MRGLLSVLILLLAASFYSNGQTFTSSNLPVVVIDTDGQSIPDDPKIMASMGIIDNGPGERNDPTTEPNNYDGKIGIEIRGSSSQMFPKKQYGVELWDDAGEGIDASLLGLPEEEDWVLFAPYNDKSLMRDVLAYKLGRDMGRYAPRTKYCEVVLNGQYNGLYVLIEKIKRDKYRVDINKLDPDEISGNNLTGGYILKLDKTTGDGGEGWQSTYPPHPNQNGQKIYFQYESPEYPDLAPEQRQYIRQFITSFENALAGENFADPVDGYANYIDVASFIDYFIISEVTKNVDAYRLSTFFYKQRDSDGGKLVMGPIWDYNLGFGNVDYCTQGNPEGFVKSFNTVCPQDSWLVPFWWDRLFRDRAFRQQVADRWTELRAGTFATSKILSYVDSVSTVLNESQQRNFQRWPVLGTYVWPNYYVGSTYAQEVDWLKNWIEQRMDWLDVAMQDIVTGESDEVLNHNLKVFPNPFDQDLIFEYNLTKSRYVTIELFDLMGKRVASFDEGNQLPGKHTVTANLPGISGGIYFYKYRFGNGAAVTGKVIKK